MKFNIKKAKIMKIIIPKKPEKIMESLFFHPTDLSWRLIYNNPSIYIYI